MTAAHLDAVMAHEHAMFGADSWSRSSYGQELADTTYRHYVAAEDDHATLLGWAGVMVVREDAQILIVGVVPSHRRAGIGQALLDALLVEAKDRGATAVFLEVRTGNEAALALYRRNGFGDLRVRRGYYDNGRADAVEMQRVL